MSYEIIKRSDVEVVTFDALKKFDFIKHGFSTRRGGISQGAFTSMNVGIKTADSPENIQENLRRFCSAVGVEADDVVVSDQIHRDTIKIVTKAERGMGYKRKRSFEGVDGLVTNVIGLPLMTFYADCVPLLIVDPVKRAVGLAHAGWPGTQLKIGQKTIDKMTDAYGSRPQDMVVVIGPSIGPCCYEVSEDVVAKFNQNFTQLTNFVIPKGGGKYQLDLWEANQISLKEIGVLERNIVKSRICTGCNLHQFYSHRKESDTGRMAALIQLSY